jgi:acyl carrier protein
MKWTRETIVGELMKLFIEHSQGQVEIKESSHIVGDLGLDSLGVMEVIADIEDKFRLTIPDDALRHVDTIADVASAIEATLKGEGRLGG